MNCHICLGSNFPESEQMLARARAAINSLPQTAIVRQSSVYATEPQGLASQPWFTNQVVKVATGKYARGRDMLAALLHMEQLLGRVRPSDPALRFGPRAIDLDLLLFGDELSADPFCELPHPRMLNRAFVLVPLREIEPDLKIGGKRLAYYLDQLPWRREGKRIFQPVGESSR